MLHFENDLSIWIPHEFPDQIFDIYKNELNAPELKLDIRKTPPRGPYNMIEWAIPTLIGMYIFKTYFDTFLKEMAKEHYKILSGWLKKTANDSRSIKVTTVTAAESTQKINKSNTQSRVFSIKSTTNTGINITFLFDESLNNEQWASAIDKLLNILELHFMNGKTDELTLQIAQNGLESSIYAKIKSDNGDWEFLSLKTLMTSQKSDLS